MPPRKKELLVQFDPPPSSQAPAAPAPEADESLSPASAKAEAPSAAADGQAEAPPSGKRAGGNKNRGKRPAEGTAAELAAASSAPAETAALLADAGAETDAGQETAAAAEAVALAVGSTDAPDEEAVPAAIAGDTAAPAPLLDLLGSGLKKKARSETHDKDRVYIRRDLKERLEALSENRGKGFKTLLLNYGLERALEELEQAEASIRESDSEDPDSSS